MKVIEYSQAAGFVDHEIPFEWKDKEEEKDFIDRCGFDPLPVRHGNEFSFEIEVFYAKKNKTYCAMVGVSDFHQWNYIVVRSQADLIALRIQLASLLNAAVYDRLDDLKDVLRRAFRVWHNHEPDVSCRHCESSEEKSDREGLEQKRLKSAK